MNLSNIPVTTYILKPTWSRLLHRMHTLGTIRHQYHNALASVTSEGEYPRLIATPNEDKSTAINGNHQWITPLSPHESPFDHLTQKANS